ncbi:uncharacterized protein [Physcomitrium patens]|nr:uncharacterized protein LOC112294716 [Physcomitrium patens]|eukprot:XP_024401243.1 uncharacterized protein LOC112294716 [Physcomitrella patens]
MLEEEDVQNLIAERDELLQKLAENAEKATFDANVMTQLRDSLAKVAAEKLLLESELNLAQDVYNNPAARSKAPSKRTSSTAAALNLLQQQNNNNNGMEDASNVDAAAARSTPAGSRQNSTMVARPGSVRTSTTTPSRKPSAVGPSRKGSAAGTGGGGAPDEAGRRSSRKSSTMMQNNAESLAQRASLLADNNADVLAQRASILAENNAEILAEKASMLAENTADVLAQRASMLAESSAVALADTAAVLAEGSTDALAKRASAIAENNSMFAPNGVELDFSSSRLLPAQRSSMKRQSEVLPDSVLDAARANLRRASELDASRRASSMGFPSSKRPSALALPYSLQESKDPSRKSSTMRPSLDMAGTSRKSSAMTTDPRLGSGLLLDQLLEKLEALEHEIMETKRSSQLANHGSFNMGDDVGIDEQQQFEYNSPETGSAPVPMRGFSEYGRKFSSLPPGIPLEPRGGSRSSTRSGSSRGSRLAEEAATMEKIANLKARVSMLECERERERVCLLEAAKKHDKSDEMLQRIQQLEMAIQQTHENYKILNNETKQLHCKRPVRLYQTNRCIEKESDNNRKRCSSQHHFRELKNEMDKRRRDLEVSECSMQQKKAMGNYGKLCNKAPMIIKSTPQYLVDEQPIDGQLKQCLSGSPTLEFTHLKLGNQGGVPSEMITFSTSKGPLGGQMVHIMEKVGKNLPQVVMQEIGKIVAFGRSERNSPRCLSLENYGPKNCLSKPPCGF